MRVEVKGEKKGRFRKIVRDSFRFRSSMTSFFFARAHSVDSEREASEEARGQKGLPDPERALNLTTLASSLPEAK